MQTLCLISLHTGALFSLNAHQEGQNLPQKIKAEENGSLQESDSKCYLQRIGIQKGNAVL